MVTLTFKEIALIIALCACIKTIVSDKIILK